MAEKKDIYQYTLRLADNCLILGQRLAECCGHGPVLEQDIAMTNISLDLIGQARNYYQYAAELIGEGKTEDDIAYLRNEGEFRNLLLLEQPNGDFAHTVLRQYFFDVFHLALLQKLAKSKDDGLSGIAQKSIKEVAYHKQWSSQWILRLGDGTDESHDKIQNALDSLWMFAFESLKSDDLDEQMTEAQIGVDLNSINDDVRNEVIALLKEATLNVPESDWTQTGGKAGIHTEHLGFILAEMQHLQRTHPGATW